MEVVVFPMQTPVVPKASPETLPELATYLAPFAPRFRRSTSPTSVERYLTGLLTDLPRKNCDTSPRRWREHRPNACNIC